MFSCTCREIQGNLVHTLILRDFQNESGEFFGFFFNLFLWNIWAVTVVSHQDSEAKVILIPHTVFNVVFRNLKSSILQKSIRKEFRSLYSLVSLDPQIKSEICNDS